MIPAISQVCCLNSPFDQDLEDLAAGHCRHVEIWLTKLEQFLEHHSVDQARALLGNHGLTSIAASFQGGLLASQADSRRVAWELLDRRLDLCAQLDIPVLVVACDVPPPLNATVLERVRHSLHDLAGRAATHGRRIALEFQAQAAIGNNLQTAAALVEEAGHPALGLCLDVFHYYIGPSKTEDLACLTRDNLFHVQVSDLADRPRELAADADRILPGDGDIPIAPLIARLRALDYQAAVSLELLNPQLWQVPARQMGEIGMTAMRKLLGQDAMS